MVVRMNATLEPKVQRMRDPGKTRSLVTFNTLGTSRKCRLFKHISVIAVHGSFQNCPDDNHFYDQIRK